MCLTLQASSGIRFYLFKHSQKFHQKVLSILIPNLFCGASKWVFGACHTGGFENRSNIDIS